MIVMLNLQKIYNEYKEMKINIPHFSITTTSNIPSPTEEQLHLMVSDPQNPIFGPLSSLDRKMQETMKKTMKMKLIMKMIMKMIMVKNTIHQTLYNNQRQRNLL